MSAVFKKVIMVPGQVEIAKVNRKSGTLYLSSEIWNRLPQAEKNFVLYHEEGHLKLQTNDEFAANKYAIGKFISAGQFTNREFGQKLMVMKSILNKADTEKVSPFVAELVAGAVTPITQALPVLGIGSKARIKETQATAAANAKIYEAQAAAANSKSKSIQNIVLIVGALLVVAVAIYFILRKR